MVIFLSFLVCMSLMPMTTFARDIPDPEITNTDNLPFAVKGKPYEYTFTAKAEGTLTWEKDGAWPDWLKLDSSTGKIHGTPTSPKYVETDIKVLCRGSDGTVTRDIKHFIIYVYQLPEIKAEKGHAGSYVEISGTNLPDGTQNSKYLGADAIVFSDKFFPNGKPFLTIDGVPDGMKTMDYGTFIALDGKPTKVGTYSINVSLSTYDSKKNKLIGKTEKIFTLKVNPDGSITQVTISFDKNGGSGSMADVTVNKSSNYTLPACTFTAPTGKEFKAWDVGGLEKAVGDIITVTANTTVKAIWKDKPVVTYAVTFEKNGGSGTMPDVTKKAGETYVLPTCSFTPPAGKKFRIWKVNGVEKAVGESITVNANTTVIAIWKDRPALTYTVSFDKNGGAGKMTAVTKKAGESYVLPACTFTAPTGKEFKAWEVGGVEKAVGESITVNANTIVKAIWVTTPSAEIKHIAAVSFSLTNFALNKSISSLQVASQTDGVVLKNIELLTYDSGEDEWIAAKGTLQANTPYRLKVVFKEKDGFDFEGLTKENIILQGIGPALKYGKINSTQEKTATFDLPIITAPVTPVAHDVHINSTTHGSVTADKTKAKKGETVTLTIKPDSGYVVDEISVMDDGASNVPVTDNKFTMPDMLVNVNVTFKAKPVTPVEKITVTFDKNGGSGSMADATVNKGSSYKLPTCGFTAPDGKEFKTWEVGGVEKAVGDNITVNANTTVKAIWKDKPVVTYTVSFDKNGGSGTMPDVTKKAGETYKLPACEFTAPAGKEFKAWEVSGVEKAVGDTITVNDNTTVKAIWKAKTVTPGTDPGTEPGTEPGTTPGTEPGTIPSDNPMTKELDVMTEGQNDSNTFSKGNQLIYVLGDSTKAVFRILGEDLEVKDLESVLLDGKLVNASNYDVRKGSIIVSFKKAYVDSLKPGTHKIRFNTTKGIGKAELVVKQKTQTSATTIKTAKTHPNTGDNGMLYVYALELLMAVSIVLILKARRNRNNLK